MTASTIETSSSTLAVRPARRTLERRRALVGWLASTLLHAVLLAAAFWSMTGSSFEGGAGSQGGGGRAITVTLVGPLGGGPAGANRAEDRSSAQAVVLKALLKKLQSPTVLPTPAQSPRAHGDLSKLFDQISQSHEHSATGHDAGSLPSPGAGEGGKAERSERAKGPSGQAVAVEGRADDRGDQGHMTGDMWSQIETCWKPVAPVPITLEVVIDTGGKLAIPAKILRPDGAAIDEKRLRAEANAVAAVGACAPFRSGRPLIGRKTYRFTFSPAK